MNGVFTLMLCFTYHRSAHSPPMYLQKYLTQAENDTEEKALGGLPILDSVSGSVTSNTQL